MEVKVLPFAMYACEQNGLSLFDEIVLTNPEKTKAEGLKLKISSQSDFLQDTELQLPDLEPGEVKTVGEIPARLSGEYLASLTETEISSLKIELFAKDKLLEEQNRKIRVLAFDQWCGSQIVPQILTSFSTPAHPAVTKLMHSASQILKRWNMSPSLEGYQSGDINRIKSLAAAAFAAIQELNVTYALPPKSFGFIGQRIRLADAIMDDRLGTCIDMTMLYSSLLEAMGLNPILVLVEGHIFAGVWLKDTVFGESIITDPVALDKRIGHGINDLIVVECTAMNAGKTQSFEDACASARATLSRYDQFEYALDVARIRTTGFRPLPVRIREQGCYKIEHENRTADELTERPDEIINTIDLSQLSQSEQTITRMNIWERKLLDFSLYNPLISLRFGSNCIPLLCESAASLEDGLSDAKEYTVVPKPAEIEGDLEYISPEFFRAIESLKKLLGIETKSRRLLSLKTPAQLNKSLTGIYRSARTMREENGANTLFLALGLLRWFDSNKSSVPHYAPIVMVPVEIKRKSASSGYTLRMSEDDSQINITLLEFLKQNFGIQVPGLDPLPLDEHGLDVEKIFAIFKYSVMQEERFDVLDTALLGNFSFSQFPMWNDIHNESARLLENKLVRSLVKSQIDFDCTLPEAQTNDLVLPAPADESQKKAIKMAELGASFVLHGPPGTGKSQTITSMISHLASKGKTVLFVAEKMAALEVVEKRLRELGLSDFILELHSAKATKKEILAKLKKSLDQYDRAQISSSSEKKAELEKLREDLDGYANALYETRNSGMSLMEMINRIISLPRDLPHVMISKDWSLSLNGRQIEEQGLMVERYEQILRQTGAVHEHPLSAVCADSYRSDLCREVKQIRDQLRSKKDAFDESIQKLAEACQMSETDSLSDIREILRSSQLLASCSGLPYVLLSHPMNEWKQIFYETRIYLNKKQQKDEMEASVYQNWKHGVLEMNAGAILEAYQTASGKLLGKKKAIAQCLSQLQAFSNRPLSAEEIPSLCASILSWQSAAAGWKADEQSASLEIRMFADEIQSAGRLEEVRERAEEITELLKKAGLPAEQAGSFGRDRSLTASLNTASEWMELAKQAISLLQLKLSENAAGYSNILIEELDRVLDHSDQLREWVQYRKQENEIRSLGLGALCDFAAETKTDQNLRTIWMASLYQTICETIIDREPALNQFSSAGFSQKVQQFERLNEQIKELRRQEICQALYRSRPEDSHSAKISRQLNILRKAIASNGRGISVRSLFEQIPDLLGKLVPCMMMSPASVSQFLSLNLPMFDLAIFDEASQIPTCKAVVVLARAKQAVIVGDPNQMPPTSFFTVNKVSEEYEEMDDLESILDDCLALGLPSLYLQWHYRSRHESLIHFSNHEFYENRMLTFPSIAENNRKVSLVRTDGIYDKGRTRTNTKEAQAVISRILSEYANRKNLKRSIGVITFNMTQQTFIEDLLAEEYKKNPDFDTWANSGPDPLFVKNLENVQGDERDLILFSIAYGPDAEGELSMNFGPLNRANGWKRLNVAVTRAKEEMIVFSSFDPDQINLRRTKARGVEALKEFLEYAQHGGHLSSEGNLSKDDKNAVLHEIARRLNEKGISYECGVGNSKFRIELALKNPYNPEEYVLGILLDQGIYSEMKDTWDREVGIGQILGSRGWNLLRIWTMDWWENPEKTWKTIEEAADLALSQCTAPEADSQEAEIVYEVPESMIPESEDLPKNEAKTEKPAVEEPAPEIIPIPAQNLFVQSAPVAAMPAETETPAAGEPADPIEETKAALVNYQYCPGTWDKLSSAEFNDPASLSLIVSVIDQILETEAPLLEADLQKKTMRALGISRATSAAQETFEKALKKAKGKAIRQNGNRFIWLKTQQPGEY